MANSTPNINLTKPVVTDNFDLDIWNENLDKIDTAAGKIPKNDRFEITTVSAEYVAERTTGLRFGNMCVLSIDFVSPTPKSPLGKRVAVIPVGYRPIHGERISIFASAWDGVYAAGWANISPNGDIDISSTNATAWFGQAVWVTS